MLEGKVIVIAGGSSGIGLATAKACLSLGASVHIIGTNEMKLDKAAELLNNPAKVFTHACAIENKQEVEKLAQEIGLIDHLITTAARLTFKPIVELSFEEILQMVNSKFWGPVFLVQQFAHRMNKEGSITFFSGVAADKGGAGASIVGALNGGLHGLAKNLAVELSPIRVNAISPGVVASPTWDFMKETERESFYKSVAESLPSKNIGTAEQLAQVAVTVMTNSYLNGSVITVDGGANA